MKIDKLGQNLGFTSFRVPPSLKTEVDLLSNVELVRKLYGQIGVDIFESKGKSISLKKDKGVEPKSRIQKLANFFGIGKNKTPEYKYDEDDTLSEVMQKYMCNETSGSYEDIKRLFGERGIEQMETFKAMGYVITNTK